VAERGFEIVHVIQLQMPRYDSIYLQDDAALGEIDYCAPRGTEPHVALSNLGGGRLYSSQDIPKLVEASRAPSATPPSVFSSVTVDSHSYTRVARRGKTDHLLISASVDWTASRYW